MKKFKIISIFILINVIFTTYCFCDDVLEEVDLSDSEISVSTTPSLEPTIYSRRAIVFERNSKVVLFEKNMNEKCAMASTTKIMTAILVLENCNLDDLVNVSQKAASTGGSRLGLHSDDKINVRDLLYGLMLCSGNDAAATLAEYVGGSIEGFSDIMNEKANKLGLTSTHFVTPHGLDDPNHFTTAYELALITDYALNNEEFKKIVGTRSYSVTINGYPKTISNTNELLGSLNGVYGVKTGFTGNAGRCLVTSTDRNDGLDIITIVLGADTKKIRTQDSANLINYCFDNFTLVDLESKIIEKYSYFVNYIEPDIRVYKGISDDYLKSYLAEIKHKSYPIKNNDVDNIRIILDNINYFEAPVKKNSMVGTISVLVNDEFLFSTNILVENEIRRKDVFYYFVEFIFDYKYFS